MSRSLEIDKLGGTSVDDMEQSGRVVNQNRGPNKANLVIVSAFSDVTSFLQDTMKAAALRGITEDDYKARGLRGEIPEGDDYPDIPYYWFAFRQLRELVKEKADKFLDSNEASNILDLTDERITGANSETRTMARAKTLIPASFDWISALLGEGITGPFFTAHLRCSGTDAVHFEAGKNMLTDGIFGKSNPLIIAMRDRVIKSGLMTALGEGRLVTTGGFYGADAEGRITTLGNGSSDRSATAWGEILTSWFDSITVYLHKADEQLAGIMSADPKIVKKPHVVNHMHGMEASFLSNIGGNVINSRAVDHARRSAKPGKRAPFPIYVKSTKRPELPGTLIDFWFRPNDPPIKVISLETKVIGIRLDGMGMNKPGISERVTRSLAEEGLDIAWINQASQLEQNLACIYAGREKGEKLEKKLLHLSDAIQRKLRGVFESDIKSKDIDSVNARPASLVGIVGKGAAGLFSIGQVFNGPDGELFRDLKQPDAYRINTSPHGISILFDSRRDDLMKNLIQSIHDSVFEKITAEVN